VAQRFKRGFHRVETVDQGLELGRGGGIGAEELDLGFNPVRHFAEAQGAGEPGAALERMQCTQHFHARALVVGPRGPLPERTAQLGHQFGAFFFKDREQVGVDRIDRIDFLVFFVAEIRAAGAAGVTSRTGGATTETGGGTGVACTGAGAPSALRGWP
jgi:hypothetical protein